MSSSKFACPSFYSKFDDSVLNPVPPPGSPIHNALTTLSDEARELYLLVGVEERSLPPSPLEMARVWVGGNRPLVVRGAAKHWPAVTKWSSEYLRQKVGDSLVSVSLTPGGYADAPNGGSFVMPQERQIAMADFLDVMEDPSSRHGVWYVQKQNSNLTEEFSALMEDLDPLGRGGEVPWFSEALGKKPDAVNFWMGDGRAVTSMHKDPYENIYVVVSGYKDFVLVPPTDAHWIPYKNYRCSNYQFNDTDKLKKEQIVSNDSEGIISSMNQISDVNIVSETRLNDTDATCLVEKELNEFTLSDSSFSESAAVATETECVCGYREQLESQTSVEEKSRMNSHTNVQEESIINSQTYGQEKTIMRSGELKECPHFSIVPDATMTDPVPWICLDPVFPDLDAFPHYANATPLRVRVRAGDALYLPSMWFHHVSQSHACIAVNYWYDMSFDVKYAYYQAMKQLTWKCSS